MVVFPLPTLRFGNAVHRGDMMSDCYGQGSA